ncbi:MAG: DUF5618 family protein [Elusimicrobiota bacterium]|jgi:hypothetical protein|nr:DUF5618 family protein [Elusimicrobiota bacterium]
MTILEKQAFNRMNYEEAMRYMSNAKEALKKAGKDGQHYYKDRKYVRTACGTAYNGVLISIDTWLKLKGVEMSKKQRPSIEFYRQELGKLDRKMLTTLNATYDTLHLAGYYDGNLDSRIIKIGFDTAYDLIDKIKTN